MEENYCTKVYYSEHVFGTFLWEPHDSHSGEHYGVKASLVSFIGHMQKNGAGDVIYVHQKD